MDVLMPQLGETVAEGKITKWFKSAGDAVKPGDNLFEIETDKTSMEVPSTSSGVLAEIRIPAGAVVPVGAVVAVISDGSAPAASAPAAAKAAAPTGATSPAATRISVSVPAEVAGTSIDTLSVSISNRLSPGLTASPIALNQVVILPSATVSPSCGIRMSMSALSISQVTSSPTRIASP
jgi:pyruvate/2-oxoglutarate dehydrogenase complex dihydrolipoamide acyltransferase (E2) component